MPETEFIDPTLLFRFEIDLFRYPLAFKKDGLSLPDNCEIPHFGALSGAPTIGQLRMAWDETGIGFSLKVTGKKQLPWCRDSRLGESDGLRLFIDTRNSSKARRANRFCHYFVFSPIGGGTRRDQPIAGWLPLEQAREVSRPAEPSALLVASRMNRDGYDLSGLIPAGAMTGFDPVEAPRIGFFYQIADREIGWQTYSVTSDFPVMVDPSLWGDVRLVTGSAGA